MSDEAGIRRANLRALCKRRGWTVADLGAELTWARYTYWRDLLDESSNKSFGEKVARRIEEVLKLGRGWLDEDHTTDEHRYPRAAEGLHSPPPLPPARFEDTRQPSDSEWQILRDLAVYPEEERLKLMAEVRAQADRWRAIERELTARAKDKSKA